MAETLPEMVVGQIKGEVANLIAAYTDATKGAWARNKTLTVAHLDRAHDAIRRISALLAHSEPTPGGKDG